MGQEASQDGRSVCVLKGSSRREEKSEVGRAREVIARESLNRQEEMSCTN